MGTTTHEVPYNHRRRTFDRNLWDAYKAGRVAEYYHNQPTAAPPSMTWWSQVRGDYHMWREQFGGDIFRN